MWICEYTRVDILDRCTRVKGRLNDANTSFGLLTLPVALLGDLHRPIGQVPRSCGLHVWRMTHWDRIEGIVAMTWSMHVAQNATTGGHTEDPSDPVTTVSRLWILSSATLQSAETYEWRNPRTG